MGVKRVVELSANIAIVFVCLLIVVTLITHKGIHFGNRYASNSTSDLSGQTLPAISGYVWSDHPRTLLLVIQRGCKFCQASLPFYKHLDELEKEKILRAHVLTVMPNDKNSGESMLHTAGLNVESIFNQSLASMNVSGTPTVLLLDPRGRITKSWVGQLNSQEEQEVIAAVEK